MQSQNWWKYSEPFKVLTDLLQGNCTSTDFFNIFFCIVIEVNLQHIQNTGLQIEIKTTKKLFQGIEIHSKRRNLHHSGITRCRWYLLLVKERERITISHGDLYWSVRLVWDQNRSQKNWSDVSTTPYRLHTRRPRLQVPWKYDFKWCSIESWN